MSAFIIVDVQNDFLPGGALAIRDGDTIIPRINALMKLPFDAIVATKDWHPADHGSFAANQGKLVGEEITLHGIPQILWPIHCVQDTHGADFATDLDTSRLGHVFYKGTDAAIDSYSCFFDNGHLQSTGLAEHLRAQGIQRVFFAGLATDYCVRYSALDALQLGFEVYVITDVCRGVDVHNDGCRQALEDMQGAGARIITSSSLLEDQKKPSHQDRPYTFFSG